MARNSQDVTDAELSVLRVLWEKGSSTIRDITALIYPEESESDYATVKKLLSRLENKKFVARNRQHLAHQFEATISLDELVGRRLQELADNLCDGSQTPLLMHLISSEKVTPQQKQKLRDLIEEISTGQSAKKKRGQKK